MTALGRKQPLIYLYTQWLVMTQSGRSIQGEIYGAIRESRDLYNLLAKLFVIFTLFGSAAIFADDEVRFVDGNVLAFGHVMTPFEPYPITCEDCEEYDREITTPILRVFRSADGSKAIVTSEIVVREFDAWLYDFGDRLPPTRLASSRYGSYLSDVRWIAETHVILSFVSNMSSASLVIDIESSPMQSVVIAHPNFIDIARNIYVSLDHGSGENSHWLVIGFIFPELKELHRQPINIYDNHGLDSVARLKGVRIEEEKLIYSFTEDSNERAIVSATIELMGLN